MKASWTSGVLALILILCPILLDATEHQTDYCHACMRDSHGKIQRSAKAKQAFKRVHPCPSTGKSTGACPGYVIDHIQPLKRGGRDAPDNMQWQTAQNAKLKDRSE